MEKKDIVNHHRPNIARTATLGSKQSNQRPSLSRILFGDSQLLINYTRRGPRAKTTPGCLAGNCTYSDRCVTAASVCHISRPSLGAQSAAAEEPSGTDCRRLLRFFELPVWWCMCMCIGRGWVSVWARVCACVFVVQSLQYAKGPERYSDGCIWTYVCMYIYIYTCI